MKSLNEDYYPYDDQPSTRSLDYEVLEEFEEEIERLSPYKSGEPVDEEGEDEESASSSKGEDVGASRVVDGASTSAVIPCPRPVSAVKGAAKPKRVRRPKNGPGLSYLDLTNIFLIKPESSAADYLVAQMYVGPFGRVRAPRPTDHVLLPPPGYFGVYPMSFAKGLRFPLHPFIIEYLDMVGLPPALLTPNSYSLMVGFLLRCEELGYRPTTALFMNLYKIGRGSHKNCAAYATLQQLPKKRSFTDLPTSIHGWKSKFVFVSIGESGTEFPSLGHTWRFNLHDPPKSSILDAQVAAFLEGGPRSVKDYVTEYKMTALGFFRYHLYGDKEDDLQLWPRMTTTFEEADGPDLGIPAEADDFAMDRRSIMAIAKAKAAEELAAKAAEAARRAAADGSGATADAAPKPAPSKKKRPATDGQKKLTDAGLSVSKKTKRAPSPSPATEAGTLAVSSVDDSGPVVDLTAAGNAAPSLPLVQEPRTKRAGKEIAGATYQKMVEYPVGGGVFDDVVLGHDVLAQAMPAKDRAYLRKLGDVNVYEGGMDLLVQSAFMLMESHKRQYREIAHLKELEQKAASADEAVACLDRLREDARALQARADEAAAARDDALAKLEESKRELEESQRALEAERRKSEEAVKAKAEAEVAVVRAADEAVEKFLAEGWKADERLPWCYEVVAARLESWGMNSPAGQEYFSREMSVYYNLGQERMQRLLCRRLSRALKAMNYTSGWARRNLKLPKLMKDPEEQANLPLLERESPIESSGLGEPDYTEFDFLDDATSAAATAGQEAEAEEGADETEEPAADGGAPEA
ncbi:unnamed protein product [Cuscuta europaea]|uniref:Transposase (putative) gypsy type domain-containing protein n=3 Tax=Cuscuta europaea TaxID=41803 RepID=A0A9P0Z9G0_CUSEU|nr:unnamed protein product [Cuscuta europaea]